MAESNEQMEKYPLAGETVVVTRMPDQASSLSEPLRSAGAEVIEAPTIAIAELESYGAVDKALRKVSDYSWVVLTSVNGVDAMFDRLKALGYNLRALAGVKIAAVGSVTAKRLAENGVTANLIPAEALGEALADKLIQQGVKNQRILILRADIGRKYLTETLQQAGAVCDDLEIYRTVCPAKLPDPFFSRYDKGEIDWITFTSPSSFLNLLNLLGPKRSPGLHDIKLASIGPVTTRAIRQAGYTETVQADPHNVTGLIDAIRSVYKK